MGRGGARRRAENPHRTSRAGRGRARPPASATARCCGSRKPARTTSAIRYTGRVIKVIDRAKQRVLGIFRALPGGGGRLDPDRQEAARPRACDPARRRRATRRTAISSRSRSRAQARLRPADRAQCKERLGSLKSETRGQPDRHPRPWHPARLSAPRRCAEAEAAQARDARTAARTGASCRSSPSIRPTPRITTTRCMPRPTPIRTIAGGFIVTVAIADVAALRAAGLRARPRGAGARQFGLFPRPRRADAAGAHLQRSVLAAARARTAPRSRCAW